MENGRWGVVIADVAGHGIGSSITMSETRAVVRAFANVTSDVGKVLTRANAIVAMDLTQGTFVALCPACINISARTLPYATAGHLGFILTSTGRTKQLLESDDPPLGIDRTANVTASPNIPLDLDDTLFLFFDGFAESVSPSGEPFGKQRAFGPIRERCGDGVGIVLHHLFNQVKAFRHDAHRGNDIKLPTDQGGHKSGSQFSIRRKVSLGRNQHVFPR